MILIKKIDVFKCKECGYEDSSFIPHFEKDKIKVICSKCGRMVDNNIIKMEYAEYMTFQEYVDLLKYINEYHTFKKLKGKRIKYISHTLDFRTLEIYKVTLDDVEFVKVNENRHRNLKEWIMSYLNS